MLQYSKVYVNTLIPPGRKGGCDVKELPIEDHGLIGNQLYLS